MFAEPPIVLSSDQQPVYDDYSSSPKKPIKKIILIISLIVAVVVFIVAIYLIVKKYTDKNQLKPDNSGNKAGEVVNIEFPTLTNPEEVITQPATTTLSNAAIEYLSFTDFYKKINDDLEYNIKDYELPINIKLDGMNYNDVSRKISFESSIPNINKLGFAIIDNPWKNEIDNFYSIYERLEEKQIPILLTSDFISYYYQNSMKKVFKDIEENIFYDNLWFINKELYNLAKNRYETRLASIGDINDSVLEGQRLEMAFFAVSLELLKPIPEQISVKGKIDDKNKFSEGDVERFQLTVPPYLRDEVLKETKLIRDAKEKIKSPIMLYNRDYSSFSVPKEYKNNAKLNNFYLAAKWLNSTFPLEYQSTDCRDCLLDKEDWRLSMIASGLIATDFSGRQDLKNRWARVYKLMAFFNGLRDEIDYVDVRDSLVSVFGENYNVEELFDDKNKDAWGNMEKLKAKLSTYEYSSIRGAIDKTDPASKKLIGFKMLTESYWPNDYIFSRLVSPAVGNFQEKVAESGDITSCIQKKVISRCNGFSLDIANLVYPMAGNDIFEKNTKYLNYKKESETLLKNINLDGSWHTSSYWSTFSLMNSILDYKVEEMPIFASSEEWRQQNLRTAVSAWINLQLPLEQFSLTPVFKGQSLSNFSRYSENVYIEPNLALINELISTNSMLAQMFTALRLNEELNLASQSVSVIDSDLNILKNIIVKELTGDPLNEKDRESITDFARKFAMEKSDAKDKVLTLPSSKYNTTLKENLNGLKLKILVHELEGNQVLSVGPVWDYQEYR